MRREIGGILCFFLVIFSLISLLSYHPADPSVNTTGAGGDVHNLFGVIGAHCAGILIGLFGLGAFWIPILLLLLSLHFFAEQPQSVFLTTLGGGVLLVVTTGSLLSLRQEDYMLLGSRFSSGGIVGIPFKDLLVTYANSAGSLIILLLLWIIGFIMATGFSIIRFCRRFRAILDSTVAWLRNRLLMARQRRTKERQERRRRQQEAARVKREVKIKAPETPPAKPTPAPKQEVFEFMQSGRGFQLPSQRLLDDPEPATPAADDENLRMLSRLLEKKLDDFGVKGHVVAVSPGPVITTFEYEPAAGVKINKIVNLTDDLALALRAASIRIVAPIPGKAAIGVEIPNAVRQVVKLKEILGSSVFERARSKLTLCLGKDVVGNPVVTELNKMPHLLIAGATGTGKSVALNAMICSLLYKATPEDVKLIVVDPKRIELSAYDGIPHLITPVVTDPKKATSALYWAVHEMERRYELLSEHQVRNIQQYNQKAARTEGGDQAALPKLPYIVIVIDELADLMIVASREVEVALTRLAQMARAAGVHLILATQRPSVDVLTGVVKANFPARLTFQVSSKTDSRTIIDCNGAETLLGSGDMLFLPPGTAKLQRIHGAFISETELAKIIAFIKKQAQPDYNADVTEVAAGTAPDTQQADYDERYDDAVALVTRSGQASISMIQRHLRIGYNRAARIIETMEKEGLVGPADGSKPREVLGRSYDDIS
jgi:S-DNA-T family DNA segregation ATPase FtsK/SpoIIIE